MHIVYNIKSPKPLWFGLLNGGGGGIRTHGTLARTTVFKTAPINRSGTPPSNCLEHISILSSQNLLSRVNRRDLYQAKSITRNSLSKFSYCSSELAGDSGSWAGVTLLFFCHSELDSESHS